MDEMILLEYFSCYRPDTLQTQSHWDEQAKHVQDKSNDYITTTKDDIGFGH